MGFEAGVDAGADEDEPPVVVDADVEGPVGAEEPALDVGGVVEVLDAVEPEEVPPERVVPVETGVLPVPAAALVEEPPGARQPRIQVFSTK